MDYKRFSLVDYSTSCGFDEKPDYDTISEAQQAMKRYYTFACMMYKRGEYICEPDGYGIWDRIAKCYRHTYGYFPTEETVISRHFKIPCCRSASINIQILSARSV